MKSSLRFALPVIAAIGCALLASCSDDPLSPQGSYTAPSYRAELLSLDANLYGVCGAGTKDVYAVGSLILHHDGTQWKSMEPPLDVQETLRFALGFANGDLVVGDQWRMFIRKNGSWSSASEMPYVENLWGNAPDDLYGRSYPGILHFDGTSWKTLSVPKADEIVDLARDENGRLLMCGYYGRIDRFVGEEWESTYIDSTTSFYSAAVSSSGRVFVADGEHIYEVSGSTATPLATHAMSNVTLRTDGETLFAAGADRSWSNYLIMAYEGGSWHQVSRGSNYFEDFWVGRGEVFGAGYNGFVWRGDASGGKRVPLYPSRGEVYSMVAIDNAIYTVGQGSYRYEDGAWSDLNKEYVTEIPAWSIDGRTRDDIYAAGPEMILHYDGNQWSWVNGALGTELNAIWVEANGDVVGVGRGPVILEYDGTEWTKTPVPVYSSGFNDVVGVGQMIVAVGNQGLVGMRRNGEWYILPRPTDASLSAVWAYDEKHIYAASRNPNEIIFFDGRTWEAMTIPGPRIERASDIWGTSPNNLFVLGFNGTLTHFNGHTWNAEERVLFDRMEALCGNGREVLAAGRLGIVSYRR